MNVDKLTEYFEELKSEILNLPFEGISKFGLKLEINKVLQQ